MENKSSYQISEQGVLGEVKIADDVIAVAQESQQLK